MQTATQDDQGQGHDQPLSQEPRPELVLQETYRLVRQIGYGGMGVVYEAAHTRLPGRFAVKVLLRSLMSNHEAFTRFCREAQIMSELRHPNVVQVVDFNLTAEKQPYFVMEYLEGRDLEAHLADAGAMPITRVVAITQATAAALGAAHRRGIVHRDLKPSNIFLCDVDADEDQDDEAGHEPFVKVLDFGVSKVRTGNRLTLGTKKMIGTPHYMAPEQAAGRIDEVDGRSDQFALAAIVFEMLTGRDAFVGDDPVTLLYQIVHEPPQPLSRYVDWSCAGVQAVLDRALAKDPALRFPTITAFSAALAASAPAAARAPRAPQLSPPMEEAAEDRDTPAPERDVSRSGEARASLASVASDDRGDSLDRIPRAPYRAIVLGLVALTLAGTVLAKGWARTLPDDAVITYRSLMARARNEPPHPQPEPAPIPRAAAPSPASPSPAEPPAAESPAAESNESTSTGSQASQPTPGTSSP